MENIADLYQRALESKEYQDLLDFGIFDVSTFRQVKNGTFIFDADWKYLEKGPVFKNGYPTGEERYYKNIKRFGVFKYQETENGFNFRIRTSLESSIPGIRKDVETSYEDAFKTILAIHSKYMARKRKRPGVLAIEDGWNEQCDKDNTPGFKIKRK
jgi:hypothetical protein